MKITIQIADEIAERYQARVRPTQSLEQLASIQLARFSLVSPHDRILIVMPEERARLEELTTRLPLSSTTELIRRVAELAEVSLGRIRFRWTPRQYEQLKERAERWRVTPAEYAEKIVRQIEEGFFTENPKEPIAIPAGEKED